jgi:hypothetical protein
MATKKERQGFMLYHSIRKPLELLDDAQRGKLFLAILDYSEHGVFPDFDDAVIDMAFAFIQNFIDRDSDAYNEKCEKRAIAGSKGGKQRVANQANQAIATFASTVQANQANASKSSQSQSQSQSQYQSQSELEQDKKKRKRFTPPTLEEVKAYCEQRHSSVDPIQFFEYFTADPDRQWIDAKGNKVTNWKAKILTWEKFDTKPAAQTAPRMNKTEQYIASMRNENHTHTADEMDKLLADLQKL